MKVVNCFLTFELAVKYMGNLRQCFLDGIGKIAASSGHAAWISSKLSRNRVFELRGRSDAIIVGGNTVRRDSKYHEHHLCPFGNKVAG